MKIKKYFIVLICLLIVHNALFHFEISALTDSKEKESSSIKLQKPEVSGTSLMYALNNRKSSRSFSSKDLSIDLLSGVLWSAFGVNRKESGKRTAPSAKNWQEIEIYVAMKDGVYAYDADKNLLLPFMNKDIREYTGYQEFANIAPVVFIYVADFSKMQGDVKTKTFYSAVDTGFISQNVYLYCAEKGLSTVVLGWVNKDKLKGIMNLDKDKQVILTQPVGYPEK